MYMYSHSYIGVCVNETYAKYVFCIKGLALDITIVSLCVTSGHSLLNSRHNRTKPLHQLFRKVVNQNSTKLLSCPQIGRGVNLFHHTLMPNAFGPLILLAFSHTS